MRVYITGPITGMPGLNIEAFQAAEDRLRAAGHEAMNPHTICQKIPIDSPHDVFMRRCLPALRTAEAIVALPGYSESKGALMEHEEAARNRIPLCSIDGLEGWK